MTELGLLVQSYNPSAICLQESHLKTCDKDKLTLKNFALYSTYSDDMERATGGSSIFINTNLIHSAVALDTELQAVAVRVSFAKTVTLCSIYVPPKSTLSVYKLHHLIEQLPAPFILLGDFNATTLCGVVIPSVTRAKFRGFFCHRKNCASLTMVLLPTYIQVMGPTLQLILLSQMEHFSKIFQCKAHRTQAILSHRLKMSRKSLRVRQTCEGTSRKG